MELHGCRARVEGGGQEAPAEEEETEGAEDGLVDEFREFIEHVKPDDFAP